jgi:hypothetical protein
MLLPDNIKPENSIYYNGAIVLQTLQNAGRANILDLFYLVSEKRRMSYSVFILCLDWLYLINIVKLDGEEVVLCS